MILAGGEGRRLGGGKPLTELRGKRLVDHALTAARQWSTRIAVAVRDEIQVEPIDAQLIRDEPQVQGPLGGLIAAFAFAAKNGCALVLTIPSDMPFLPPDLLERLSRHIGDRGCALASSGGHVHPVCGLWRTSSFERLPGYLASGRRSLQGFAEAIGRADIEWPTEPIDPFLNVNSPEDLTEAERLLAR